MLGKFAFLFALSAVCAEIVYYPRLTVDKNGVVTEEEIPIDLSKGYDERVVGGIESNITRFPHMASMRFYGNLVSWFCGGSLIGDRHILTAAHCISRTIANATSVDILLGSTTRVPQEAGAVQVTVNRADNNMLVHEDWRPTFIRNDIGIITLDNAVTFTDTIQAIPLTSVDAPAGTDVTVSGWGLASDNDTTSSNVLREVTIPIANDTLCSDYYGATFDSNTQICIDAANGMGACSGDSGGPLNWDQGNGWIELGIVSYGPSAGCESTFPQGFTKVTYYNEWISNNTGITPP